MGMSAFQFSRLPSAYAPRRTNPAGQTAGSSLGDIYNTDVFGGGGTGTGTGTTQGNFSPNITSPNFSGGGTSGTGLSGSDQALYNTVGGALNTTGATIASIVNSNNQVQIAQLQSQTQQQIASLQASAQTAQQQGNIAVAQAQLQQAAQLQQFNAMLATRINPNTTLYVIAGIAGLIVVGGIVWAISSSKGRRENPRRRYR